MRLALSFLLFGFTAHASTNAECARAELANIYSAQKAYYAQKHEFAEDFGDIGYDPNFSAEESGGRAPASAASCSDWVFSIDRVERPGKFSASAHCRTTGEEYVIDESSKISKK